MAHSNQHFIELALQNRFITRKQADFVNAELASFPGESAADVLLKHRLITPAQVEQLTEQMVASAMGGGGQMDSLSQMETAQLSAGSARPPSLEEIKAKREAERQAGDSGRMMRPATAAPAATAPPRSAQPVPVSEQLSNQPKTLAGFLKLARHWGCSDLHLSVGRPPFVRMHGHIRYMEMDPLTPEKAEELNFSGLSESQKAQAHEFQQLDFPLEVEGVGRHRCNLFKQRLGWDGSYRVIRNSVPTFEELGLPQTLRVFTEYNQGLVMVTGPGGSGKTTTVAAMLDLVNSSRKDHIITVEDPVEYVIPPKNCQVTQREVGRHTESFGKALRAALREDPDIIFIGELRDLETTSISISAAETGHLVFGTLHTGSAVRTVSRIVDVYPLEQQVQVRTMVAESLRGVISQQLIPRKDKKGRALALEVLVNTSGVSTQLKEGKTHMVTSLIQSGKKLGMMLMDESVMNLFNAGLINGQEAYRVANNKAPFEAHKDKA